MPLVWPFRAIGVHRARFCPCKQRPNGPAARPTVVNAEVHPKPSFSLVPTSPSLATIVNAVADVGIYNYNYNFETLELMRESLSDWLSELPPDAHGRRVQTYLIDVAFDALEDPRERDFF